MRIHYPGKLRLIRYACIFISLVALGSCSMEKSTASDDVKKIAPEIVSTNTEGVPLKLSDSKGKMVLVEFWCATSPECRKNHREMQSVYEQYKNETFKNGEGFTIFSVSIDNNTEIWKNAIAQDNVQWTGQVCDLKGWNSDAVLAYDVHFLPKYFLIDGEGEIITKNIFIKDLGAMLNKYKK